METSTFAGLGLSAKVLAAIEASGYTQPTPIQSQAIPVAMTGRDVLGIAQTGTGKTAAFVMPMIARLESGRARARMPRSLILAPTRELAAQVAQSFEKYGQNHKLDVALLIGGVSMDDQVKKLDRGVDVLIATPGRLLDHFGRGRIMLMGVEILVIDEADRMLDMGFIPDIEKICKLLPPKRQTLFFSATMPPEITRLVATFLRDPVRIEVARPATAAATITQRFCFSPSSEDFDKRQLLRDLIKSEKVRNAIIFCNRKRDVAILLKSLLKHGFNAGALHGDMDQSARTATLDKFRAGEIALLAASDVAARGLDIPDVSHVFNFDVPWQADDYVHRIGRTGRAGKEGFSATLVTPEDFKAVAEIEKIIGAPAEWIGEPPTADEIAEGSRRKRGGRFGRGRPAARSSDRGEARGPRPERGMPRGDRRPDRPTHAPRAAAAPATGELETVASDAVGTGLPASIDTARDTPRAPRERRPRGDRAGGRPREPRPSMIEAAGDLPPRAPAADERAAQTEQADAPAPQRPSRHEERPRRAHDDHARQARPPRERSPRPAPIAPGAPQPVIDAEQPFPPREDLRPVRRDERAPRAPGGAHAGPRERAPNRRPEPAAHREAAPARDRGRDQSRDRQREPARDAGGGRAVGFADNLPAFLRRPPRP